LSGFSFGVPPTKQSAYSAWPISIVLVIEDALRKAYASIEEKLDAKHTLQSANEDTITNALQTALIDLRKDGKTIPGFSISSFAMPVRGQNIADYSGDFINKQPDLTFYQASTADLEDGWFCECKIVDGTHSLSDYLHKGLIRFVNGNYAYAMPHAQMIAYVRDSKKPADLIDFFNKKPNNSSHNHACLMSLNAMPKISKPDLIITTHNRGAYSLPGKSPLGEIEVRQIWLSR
jgi:hypothetical protein